MGEPAMREAYGDALLEMAGDKSVVVLDGDLSGATSSDRFAKAYPERFFNMGIAEQNLMGAAAGMALAGLKPFVSTFALFGAGRAFEVIRNGICYQKAAVRFAATHAGLSANADGGSHQAVEDLALMRVLPGMTVLCPCDYEQARDMILQMKDRKGPSYIRLSRHPVPPLTKRGERAEIGKIQVMREGSDVCIAATGVMTARALEAARILETEGISAAVLNVHTIKPFDVDAIQKYAKQCGGMVTAEEHSVLGGLGDAVSEAMGQAAGAACEVKRVGIRDLFGQSGDLEELMEAYGLTAECLAMEAEGVFKRKNSYGNDEE